MYISRDLKDIEKTKKLNITQKILESFCCNLFLFFSLFLSFNKFLPQFISILLLCLKLVNLSLRIDKSFFSCIERVRKRAYFNIDNIMRNPININCPLRFLSGSRNYPMLSIYKNNWVCLRMNILFHGLHYTL